MNPLWLLLGGPALGAALSGTVVDEAGEPVPGAVIQAYDVLLRAEETETDAMGRWRIEDLAAGTWRVRAVPAYTDNLVARWHPAAQDFCGGERLQLHASSEQAGVQITVPDGAAIRGRLVDSMGAPVVNEVVWAVGADEPTESLVARPTLSGPTGEFVVRGLDTPPDGAGLWTLYARVDGFPDQYLGGVYDGDDAEPVVLSEGERTDVGTWGLNDGILVRGHAMGPGGPLAGASVHVYAGGQVVTVSSEDDGSWEAIGLPPGDVLPWVSAAGHALTYFPNHDRPTEYAGTVPTEGGLLDVGDILAPREARLFVDVVDADDGSALGSLSALLYNSDQTVGRGNQVDSAGRLVIDRLHPGDYRLYLWGESVGYADTWALDEDGDPATVSIEETGDMDPLRLALPRAGTVAGQVMEEDGTPLAGASVALRRLSDASLAAATTDREGRFLVGGLAAGHWTAQVAAEPLCPGDPGAVTMYFGPTVNPAWQDSVLLEPGGRVTGVEFRLPADQDRDRMADTWEKATGLDPTRDDSTEDPDDDTYDNLTEYRLGTDPFTPAAGPPGCGGCRGRTAAVVLLLPMAALRRRRRT